MPDYTKCAHASRFQTTTNLMQALKDKYYNNDFYLRLSKQLSLVYPSLNKKGFYRAATHELDQLGLKERIAKTAMVCREFLPGDYKKALKILYDFSDGLQNEFVLMFMPEFVARFGQDHYNISIKALRDFTQYSSSELAIRVFLKNDLYKTIKVMRNWAEDDNHHVRRLASEGCRPRLPWAIQIKPLISKPGLTLPILAKLRADREDYVKRSVANHLNDISKDNPEWMLSRIETWDISDPDTAWIVRHAARSLIKKGDHRALKIFGFDKPTKVTLEDFRLKSENIAIGDTLQFSLAIKSETNKTQKLAIDYIIYYVKKSGKRNPKVFKLRELALAPYKMKPDNKISVRKSHRFRNFSTRTHYPGQHSIEIIVNGVSMAKRDFSLSP